MGHTLLEERVLGMSTKDRYPLLGYLLTFIAGICVSVSCHSIYPLIKNYFRFNFNLFKEPNQKILSVALFSHYLPSCTLALWTMSVNLWLAKLRTLIYLTSINSFRPQTGVRWLLSADVCILRIYVCAFVSFCRTLARRVWRLSISSFSHLPGLSSFCRKT